VTMILDDVKNAEHCSLCAMTWGRGESSSLFVKDFTIAHSYLKLRVSTAGFCSAMNGKLKRLRAELKGCIEFVGLIGGGPVRRAHVQHEIHSRRHP
jgi:hypothetical protein